MDTHLSFSAVVSPFSAVDVLSHWFHLGASGLSLDLGFSSFFLGDITPGLSLSSVNSHVRVLLLHALFCVFEFGTLVACLTLVFVLSRKHLHTTVVAIGVEFDTFAFRRGYGAWILVGAERGLRVDLNTRGGATIGH